MGLVPGTLKKLAIVSTAVPPGPSGQARVLGQIMAPGAVAAPLWFTDQIEFLESEVDCFGKYISLTPARFSLFDEAIEGYVDPFNNWAGLLATVFERAIQIVAELKRNRVDVVIGASGIPFDIPSAWLAARRLRLPFAAWLFDDPVMQWPKGIGHRGFARTWERFWANDAIVLVPNELMAEIFSGRHRYSKAPHVVRNPAPAAAFVREPRNEFSSHPIRIVYTGSIYSAQADAVRDLIEALERMGGRFELHVYSGQSEATLAQQGIHGRFVHVHEHLPHDAALVAQQQADILFLPLAFCSDIPEVIRSSSPAKLSEYLVSLRPILAYAPPGSFVCKLISESGAGLVVDTQGPSALILALREMENKETRERIKSAARQIAHQFHVDVSRRALFEAVTSEVS